MSDKQKLLELNFVQGEKVCITPIGEVTGADGRLYRINPASLINNVRQHIPLFENHNDWGKSIGWFDKNTLEVRPDGIYASLELNNEGQPLVSNKAYRYLSPTYWVQENREVIELVSVGLVNQPNLLFKELNNKDVAMSHPAQPQPIAQPVVQPTAPIVPNEDATAVKAENNRLSGENETLKKQLREHEINAMIAKGELTEAQRDIAMVMDDKTLALLVDANKKDKLSTRVEPDTKQGATHELNSIQLAMCEQLGITPEQFKLQM